MKFKKAQFLGSGGSMGVPIPTCACSVCQSSEPKNKRLRPSFLLEINGYNIVIDITPDFRQQALTYGIDRVDAVFLSHTHFDHAGGMPDLRMFAYHQARPIPIYCSSESHQDLERRFDYLFSLAGVPIIETRLLEEAGGQFSFEGIDIAYYHYAQSGMRVTGFRLGTFAYVTDLFDYDEGIFSFLQGVTHLVISARNEEKCVMHKKAHLTAPEAVDFAKKAGARYVYFNHLSHEMDHYESENKLPDGVKLAYDGMIIPGLT